MATLNCLQACSSSWRRSVSDSSLDDFDAELAVRRSLWKNQKLLPPLSERMPLRNAFEWMLGTLMWYTGIVVPLMACFRLEHHPAQLAIEYCIDALYWVDICMTMRTAYYDGNQELVVDREAIQEAYIRRRFVVDAAANFPWEVFTLAAGCETTSPIFAAARLVRLLRFCRMIKVHKPVLVDANASAGNRMIAFFPLITHWTACIWWAIGYDQFTQGFVDQKDVAGGSSWLVRPNTKGLRLGYDSGMSQNYFSSLYWATSTLMKTAWIPPSTLAEKSFACFIVLVGAIMFAVIIAQINLIIRRVDKSTEQRREKLSTFRHFCQQNKLGPAQTRRIIGHAMAEWKVTQGVLEGAELKKLPPVLAGEMMYEMRKDLLDLPSCHLLFRTSRPCAKLLLMKSTTHVCLKNDHLAGYGQIAIEIFVLQRGSLQILMPANTRHKASLGKGAPGMGGKCFESDRQSSGQSRVSKKNHMLFRMLERPGSITGTWNPYDTHLEYPFEVVAKSFSTLLNIPRVALVDTLTEFPSDRPSVLALLENEYMLTMQALKLGKSGRSGSRSGRPSAGCSASVRDLGQEKENGDPIDVQKAHAAQLREMRAALGAIDATLARSASEMSQLTENASLLTTILEALTDTHTGAAAESPRTRLES